MGAGHEKPIYMRDDLKKMDPSDGGRQLVLCAAKCGEKIFLVPATVTWGNFLPNPNGSDCLYTKHESRSGTVKSVGPPRGGPGMWPSQWPPDVLDHLNHHHEEDWENWDQARQFLTIHCPLYT